MISATTSKSMYSLYPVLATTLVVVVVSTSIPITAANSITSSFDDLFFGFPPMLFPGRIGMLAGQTNPFHQPSKMLIHQGPEYTVTENDDRILITMDVAGFAENEVSLALEESVLKIAGIHQCENPDICMNRSFTRSFDIRGSNIDLNEISARRSVDSIISVTLPKIGREKRSIPITLEEHVETVKDEISWDDGNPSKQLPKEQVVEIESKIAEAQQDPR